jgi:hypothetical protein
VPWQMPSRRLVAATRPNRRAGEGALVEEVPATDGGNVGTGEAVAEASAGADVEGPLEL